jgi:hypothetical protein
MTIQQGQYKPTKHLRALNPAYPITRSLIGLLRPNHQSTGPAGKPHRPAISNVEVPFGSGTDEGLLKPNTERRYRLNERRFRFVAGQATP